MAVRLYPKLFNHKPHKLAKQQGCASVHQGVRLKWSLMKEPACLTGASLIKMKGFARHHRLVNSYQAPLNDHQCPNAHPENITRKWILTVLAYKLCNYALDLNRKVRQKRSHSICFNASVFVYISPHSLGHHWRPPRCRTGGREQVEPLNMRHTELSL